MIHKVDPPPAAGLSDPRGGAALQGRDGPPDGGGDAVEHRGEGGHAAPEGGRAQEQGGRGDNQADDFRKGEPRVQFNRHYRTALSTALTLALT